MKIIAAIFLIFASCFCEADPGAPNTSTPLRAEMNASVPHGAGAEIASELKAQIKAIDDEIKIYKSKQNSWKRSKKSLLAPIRSPRFKKSYAPQKSSSYC